MLLLGGLLAAQAVGGSNVARAYDGWFGNDFFFGDEWRSDSVTFGHGNAVAHNIAVQTVDPWPPYVGKSRIDIDGERLLGHPQGEDPVSGIRGYKANRSIPPRGLESRIFRRSSGGN